MSTKMVMNGNQFGLKYERLKSNKPLVLHLCIGLILLAISVGFFISFYQTALFLILGSLILFAIIRKAWILYLLIFLLPFDMLIKNSLMKLDYPGYWKEFLISVLLIAICYQALLLKRFKHSKITFWIFAYLAYLLFHIVFTENWILYYEGFKVTVQMFIFFLFGFFFLSEEKDFSLISIVILLSGVIQAFIGIDQVYRFGIFESIEQANIYSGSYSVGITGTFNSYYNYGFFLIMILYLTWVRTNDLISNRLMVFLKIIFSGLIMFNIFNSNSRSAWISFLGTLAFKGSRCGNECIY
ncbi:MAG: hypothetical protein A2161_01170 [Candidatus Schekmanbacteria bacterium RBG_13_48_7]|uniref:Uncharacterized protein n=1 Tax=Candidatus Schekmanbacteria bacterium RBG_13_48_7 TaxID=1817878 RepID=A0A1F7RP01_9BACT|nr:MAG: hypothetical protein A2161_01170 [Candidatus Schekmanbacteria bacterium RBG_13_48_7]